jgi:hypothetical protein
VGPDIPELAEGTPNILLFKIPNPKTIHGRGIAPRMWGIGRSCTIVSVSG